MKDWNEYFEGKKITVMRIGLLGRGVGDVAFLASQGAEVLVVDSSSQSVTSIFPYTMYTIRPIQNNGV